MAGASRKARGIGLGLAVFGATQCVACGSDQDSSEPIGTQTPALVAAKNPSASAAPGPTGGPKAVTLITGDRVIVRDTKPETLSIVRGPGRERIHFSSHRVPDASGRTRHLFVIPEDAVPLLAKDQVDRRLFDVAKLIEFEYDDAHRSDLPLIVTYAPSAQRALTAAARTLPGAAVRADLPVIHGMSVTSPKTEAHEVWGAVLGAGSAARSSALAASTEPIEKLWLDGLRQPVLDRSVPQIGAPAAWELGYDGDGVTVAVLDTGVDVTHPDLSSAVVASQNFTTGPEVDEVGHGTHVASIIAGSGAAEGGRYRGVAPRAQLLSGKVCEIFGCPESSILAGMQWAVVDQGARLVNFSIGGMDEPGIDPLEAAIDSLSADFGALFVVAAGNAGDTPQSVSSPGTATLALSVGAVDRSDEVAEFSGRGLSVGSYAVKPELTAPGVGIVAARAQGTLLGLPVGDAYVSLSGTSMATPHVAGAAALLLQQHPEWGARELKAALIGSSQNSPAWGVADQGAGRVDIEAALDLNLFVDPPSTSFGIASWPHEDDEPVERTLTYQNLGGAIDLSFELDVKGPDGVRPPAEMFSVTPATLHIPAGETATVTVTARTSVAGPNGTYGGRLLASDGAGRTVATPLAVYRETESYDLTIRHIGRDDQPADYYFFLMVGLDQFYVDFFFGTPGEDVTRRVPGGRYTAGTNFGAINSPDPWAYVILAVPELSLDEDRLLELDGRVTEPISLRAPTRRADLAGAGLSWFMHGDVYGLANSYWFLEELDPLYYSATIGPVPPEFVSFVHAEWTDTTQTPSALYAAAWVGKEGLPQEPLARITKQSTAVVDASYAASLTESPVWNDLSLLSFVRDVGGGLTFLADLPLRRTEHYFSDDSATTWMTELWIHDPAYATNLIYGFEPRSLRPGKRYRSHWNQPPFSVHLSEELQAPYTAASRAGDVIAIAAATYSDNEQHAGYIAAQGTTSLYRNGELIGFSDYGGGGNFDVPPEPAEYRLELEEAQGAFELSTQQQTVWSFESSHADGEERLPLLVVHFDPELDDRGRAPRGRDFTLPLSVQQYGQSGTPRVRRPKLEVSFDDGVTWTRANVERDGHNWRAEYEHPRHGDYVSLRVSTLDGEGNAVEQTLIRAYALAERRGGH